MSYKEIYLKAIGENTEVETINRINEIAYDMMMDLPDPELWEILNVLNPTAKLDIVFLDNEDDTNGYFQSAADLVNAMRNNAEYAPDLTYDLMVIWDGRIETVDEIRGLDLDWGDVFDQAVEDVLWDYIEPETNAEMVELFGSLEKAKPWDEPLTQLIINAVKKAIENKYDFIPEWVKDWAIEGIVEYTRFMDVEWVADYIVNNLENDIDKIVDIWC